MTPSRHDTTVRPILALSLPSLSLPRPTRPSRRVRQEKSRGDKSRVLESTFELRLDGVLVTATGEILLAALQP